MKSVIFEPQKSRTDSPAFLSTWQQRVLAAHERIRASVTLTPLEPAPGWLKNDAECFFKREDLQQTGSFKLRGATNKILSLTPSEASKGVIAASNGNHGLGVALAAKCAGIAAEVYVSSHVSPAKAARIEQLGASLRRAGSDPLQAELAARAAAEKSGKIFISPYNDVEVMAGQGTIAVELLQQAGKLTLDAVFVAVGGGGMIGGIGAYLKSVSPTGVPGARFAQGGRPATEIIGCWPENSRVLYESMKAGRIVDVPEQPTLSESTAGGLEPDSVTLDVCRQVIDRAVMVSEAEILAAMRRVRESEGWLMEGAAAVAVSAFQKEPQRYRGKKVAIIICGGNVSPEVMGKVSSAADLRR